MLRSCSKRWVDPVRTTASRMTTGRITIASRQRPPWNQSHTATAMIMAIAPPRDWVRATPSTIRNPAPPAQTRVEAGRALAHATTARAAAPG